MIEEDRWLALYAARDQLKARVARLEAGCKAEFTASCSDLDRVAESEKRVRELEAALSVESDGTKRLVEANTQLTGKLNQCRECARELLPFAIAYGSHPHRAEKDDLPKALAAFERLEKGEGK
jgi:hypothetical protein